MSERRLLSASDVLALPDPIWLADQIIPVRSLSMLWGPSGVGKSFFALDLACSVAVGNDWLGHSVQAGPVIYVAAEGVQSFKKRIAAWLAYNALDRTDLDDNLSFASWPLQLHEETAVSSFMKIARKKEPSLVIIDTLAASSLGVEEDTTAGIGATLKALLTLRKELDSAILAVHHTGWVDEGNEEQKRHERGSSGLRAPMDTSIEVREGKTKWSLSRTLVCHKQRDAEKFDDIAVTLRKVKVKGHTSLVPTIA